VFQGCISKGIVGGAFMISSNKQIVSIVDDELDITELFRDAICDSIDGISVVTFNDPVLALEHFTDNKKDYVLVISDLRMSSMNGLELLKKIKSSSPNVRTILMSVFDFEFDELYRNYSEAGFVDSSIEKPVTIAALCQRVRDEFQVYQLKLHLR
jgi:two-component system response regulator YesN